MRLFALFCAVVLLASAVSFAEEPLVAGVSTVNLTPPLEWKFALGGYGARMSKPAEGVHDWVWVKALVFRKGETRLALVTLDIVGLPPNIKPEVLQRLSDPSWTAQSVLLLPSHSHASLNMSAINSRNVLNLPQIGIYDARLKDWVVGRIVEAIRRASENLVPVAVGVGSTVLEGMNHNRRGDGITDPELTVVRVDRLDGSPFAVVVNWTAHPTLMDEHDMWVSGGWPGYLQRELEAWIGRGVVAMYFNGAEGDQSPSGAVGASHYQQAEDYGRKIAVRAKAVYDGIAAARAATLRTNYRVVKLPPKAAHPLFAQTGGAEYGLDDVKMKRLLDAMVPDSVGVQAVRIGDLLIAGVPGEMIAALGLRIKKALRQAGASHPVIGGLANEWISYILSADEYEQGGYEASVSFYGPTLGNTLVEAILRVSKPLVGQ